MQSALAYEWNNDHIMSVMNMLKSVVERTPP